MSDKIMVERSMMEKSNWHKLPRWKKRLHGWLSYQVYSWFALFFPEPADAIMYKALKDQFEEMRKEKEQKAG